MRILIATISLLLLSLSEPRCARSRLSGPRESPSRLDGQHSTARSLADVHAKFGGGLSALFRSRDPMALE